MKLAINKRLAPVLLSTVLIGGITGYFGSQNNRNATLIMGAGIFGAGFVIWTTTKE